LKREEGRDFWKSLSNSLSSSIGISGPGPDQGKYPVGPEQLYDIAKEKPVRG
jgi:hypothetical protein